MSKAAAVVIAGLGVVVCAGAGRLQAVPQQPTARVPTVAVSPADRPLVARYCVSCHNERLRTGGLALDTVDPSNPAANAAVWEKVVLKLRAGVMPPVGLPKPDSQTREAFLGSVEGALDAAAAAHPNPGRPPVFHRLNRAEYRNVVRDLLALDVDVASLLPSDTESYGFDNIGDALGMSPLLLERYLSAARRISRLAVGSPAIPPTEDTYRASPELTQDDRFDGLPFGTRGGLLVRHTFPLDGEYLIRVKLSRDYNMTINGVAETLEGIISAHQLEITLDGERLKVFPIASDLVKPGELQKYDGFYAIDRRLFVADDPLQIRVPVKAGVRSIGVTFLKRPATLSEDVHEPSLRADIEQADTHMLPYVSSVTVSGPFSGRTGETVSRQRIFTCRPASGAAAEAACARQIISTLARRAYRRPVTDADLRVLLASYEEGRKDGFETGVEKALLRMLVSPSFVFRIERDPAGAPPGSSYRISEIDLASRLSFFLWSSIPDDPLLDAAEKGTLNDPATLERQVRRMLADPRSASLVTNFAGQWLFLRNVEGTRPDRRQFPDFDENLRMAFRRETELFFDSIMREDRSLLDLLTADYTFVNERLARHYGIPNVYGDRFRRVTVTDGIRGGLLGQGSILTVRSYSNRTSPVLRGVWILENLLGTPPPPPPPNVPDLMEKNAAGKVMSMRERMVLHRSNPACSSCHAIMDPLGLPLENFDAIGRWRTTDESNQPLDVSGALPSGVTFEGVAGLRRALLTQSDQIVATFTDKLLTYAVGRGTEFYDAPAIRRIVRDAAAERYKFSTLVMGIVKSVPFQMRKTADGAKDSQQ